MLQKQFSIKLLLSIVAIAALGVTTYLILYPPTGYVGLCSTSSTDDISNLHIANLVEQNGIDAYSVHMMGGGWSVRRSQYAQAVRLLEEAAAHRGATLTLSKGKHYRFNVKGDETDVFTWSINKHIDELLNENSERASVVRAVKKSGDSELDRLPYVVSLEGCVRQYLGSDGAMQIGYDFEIELVDDLTASESYFVHYFQVLEEFSVAVSSGGAGSFAEDQDAY